MAVVAALAGVLGCVSAARQVGAPPEAESAFLADIPVALPGEAPEAVEAALERCNRLFRDGERLYEMGNYRDAKSAFVELQQMGIDCGAEIEQAVEEYLADIRQEARAGHLIETKKHLQRLQELRQQRQKSLEEVREVARLRRQALEALEAAKRDWEAGRFKRAKTSLQEAKGLLEGLDLKGDEELEGASQEVEGKLARVDAEIEAKRRREDQMASLRKRFERIEVLKSTDLLAAEVELLKAEQFARHANLPLTPAELALAEELKRTAVQIQAEEWRERADRNWELVERSEDYAKAGEWERALALLECVQQAEGLRLGRQRSKRLSARIQKAAQHVFERTRAVEQVNSTADRAAGLMKAGRAEEALAKYREALEQARESEVSLGRLVSLLEGYEEAASRVLPDLVGRQAARYEELAERAVAKALTEQELWEAQSYVEKGSYDAAKPLLIELAGDEQLDEEKRQWAAQQLRDIEARIEAVREEDLFATKDSVEAVYRLERDFEIAAEKGDLEAVEAIAEDIARASLRWLVARARAALRRGAYGVADQILEGEEGIVAQNKDAPALRAVLEQVQRWKACRPLVAEATEALRRRDAEAASRALAQLQRIELPHNPLDHTVQGLQEARNALVRLGGRRADLRKKQQDALGAIRRMLARARSEEELWNRYLQATKLYAAGDWPRAESALVGLMDYAGALRPFEKKHVRQMLAELWQKITAPGAGQAEGAEEMLQKAEAKVAARRFRQAASLLQAVEQHRDYESVRHRAEESNQRVAAAESEAARLYEKAAEAYEAEDRERLKQLLLELKLNYRHTRAYAEHE